MKPSEILALAELAKEYMPVIKSFTPLVKDLGGELKELFDGLNSHLIKTNLASIKTYEDAGLSREEAVLLTINARAAMTKVLDGLGKK